MHKLLIIACVIILAVPVLGAYILLEGRTTQHGYRNDGTLRYTVSHGYAELERDGCCFGKNGFSRELTDGELAQIIVGGDDSLYLRGCDE